MSETIIKFIAPLTKKSGMSREAFREYYETHHRLLGEKYLKDHAIKYFRRYPLPTNKQPDFDVLLEIWYPNMEAFRASMQHLQREDIAKEIREDEEKLFDRSKMGGFIVEEAESTL